MSKRTLALAAILAASVTAGAARADSDAGPDLAARRTALSAKSATLSKDDAAREHYTLGLWAREHHLENEAREEFQAAVAVDPSNEAAHQALGDVKLGDTWIGFDAAMKAKGLVQRDGKWILKEDAEVLDAPAAERARRTEEHAKVAKLLATYASGNEMARKLVVETLGTVDARYKVDPFAYALRSKSKDVRLLAAGELGKLKNRRALKALVFRAVHDDEKDVRMAEIDAAKAIGDDNLIAPLVSALGSKNAQIRMNAAEDIGRVGDVRGVRYLVYRMDAYGGGGPRCYSFFGSQLTYIQDFDVQVAQTAFIADPVVGTIQEGICLDAQVQGTEEHMTWTEREVLHGALSRLTGMTDVKNEPGAWAAWWRAHGEDLEKTALAAK